MRRTHLFILSGQSNMARLDPSESFAPTVRQELAGDRCVVVKNAYGGQPIRRWYKGWRTPSGDRPATTGSLYDRLMEDVRSTTDLDAVDTVTFVWMQGERDAREGYGEVYAESLVGLVEQLKTDLGRDDLNVVIGRLSDFDLRNESYPHWTIVRQAQVAAAEPRPNWTWVDTDDYNGPADDLHCTAEGYRQLGQDFARAAVALIGDGG